MKRTRKGTYRSEDATSFIRHLLDESDQQAIVFFGLDGVIRGWNSGAGYITGFTPDDMLGQTAAILYTPEDRERKLDEYELQTALVVGVAEDDRWHMRKDGSRFWSSGVVVPLRKRGGKPTGFVKIFRDRTSLRTRIKSLENAVQEQALELEQRDAFLGAIAHELRNPLAPVKAATRMIETLTPADGRLQQSIKIIGRQVATLERLVEDLVDLTRTKAGKFTVVYERAEVQSLVTNAVEACRAAAASKNIDLSISVPSVPIELELDAGRMHQVLVNLLTNAIKYTPVKGSVWVTATADQTHAVFLVKDDGMGISADLMPRIFNMFTQAPEADARRGAGLGIGLALVKQVVELHQGTIEVRSEGEGKGSEFHVRVPLRKPQGPEAEPFTG